MALQFPSPSFPLAASFPLALQLPIRSFSLPLSLPYLYSPSFLRGLQFTWRALHFAVIRKYVPKLPQTRSAGTRAEEEGRRGRS